MSASVLLAPLAAAAAVAAAAWTTRPCTARRRLAGTPIAIGPGDEPPRWPHRAARLSLRPLAMLLAVGTAAAWSLPVGVGLAGGWVGAAAWHRDRRRRADREAVARALPDVIDLLVAAVRAGFTPRLAFERLAPLLPPPVAGAVDEVLGLTRLGVRFADALERLPARLGPACWPLVGTLGATERHGTPLGPALDALALEARHARRRAAEAAARRLPVRLAFPLVGCVLPAFVLLTIVPLAAATVRSLRL